MSQSTLTRRAVLAGGAALGAGMWLPGRGSAAVPAMHVLKDPTCGCCTAWVAILEREGFGVTVEEARGTMLTRYKIDSGVPVDLFSCHTGMIDGYVIEGHVPVADIRRLLEERPDAVGLAVPGMPYGSPGMGPEEEREAFDVMLILRDGRSEVFTRYDGAA
ncbi:DUF411 domain-containing protein [Histidinibacterium aquaticum]|uniref:DUF411 domain-containing protein n=1 Tax=Histidinibacterium aquaticum TaxID=2613962 RepID=A0A5J5GRE0_9RHOB|nr:DUF411 domain-containing protein [Histidinibacterium aquaticum]KAA9010617.1 DUF411 domain-containing protein [Histidinibacterium aquaticum]